MRRVPRVVFRQPGEGIVDEILPFPLEVPDYDAYLYWHVNADADPANQWLRKQLMGAFREQVRPRPAGARR